MLRTCPENKEKSIYATRYVVSTELKDYLPGHNFLYFLYLAHVKKGYLSGSNILKHPKIYLLTCLRTGEK